MKEPSAALRSYRQPILLLLSQSCQLRGSTGCVFYCRSTVNSSSCLCYRKIHFWMKFLFKFLKVPSIRCDRAIFKIRSHECCSSSPSRRPLRPPNTKKKVKQAIIQFIPEICCGSSGEPEVCRTEFTQRYISRWTCVELWECWQGSFYPRLSFASGSIRQMLLSPAPNLDYHQRSCWPCPTCPL